jgi:hypothetical protein
VRVSCFITTKNKGNTFTKDDLTLDNFATSIEEILKMGAKKVLQLAIENEVAEFIESFKAAKK